MLVKSQRSISCWVAPNTYPYLGVTSSNFLELLKKNPEWGLLRSTLIRCSLAVCGHHVKIAQLMTITWFKIGMSYHRVCPLPSVLHFSLILLLLMTLNCVTPVADTYVKPTIVPGPLYF